MLANNPQRTLPRPQRILPPRPVRLLPPSPGPSRRPKFRRAKYSDAQRPPLAVAERYAARLIQGVRRLHADIREAVAPALHELSLRQDAADDTARVLARLRVKYANDPDFARAAQQAGEATDAANRREFQRIIPIQIPRSQQAIANKVDEFRKRNVSLITSVHDDLLDEVDGLVQHAYEHGTRHEVLAGQIESRFGVSESRSRLIARDQVLKLNANIAQDRQQAAGIVSYTWVTAHDERVRPFHRALSGQTFRYDDPPVVDANGRRANPGEDFQCRCVAAPDVPDFAAVLGPSPGDISGGVPAVTRSASKFQTSSASAPPVEFRDGAEQAAIAAVRTLDVALARASSRIRRARHDSALDDLDALLQPLQAQARVLSMQLIELRGPIYIGRAHVPSSAYIAVKEQADALRAQIAPIMAQIEIAEIAELQSHGIDTVASSSLISELSAFQEHPLIGDLPAGSLVAKAHEIVAAFQPGGGALENVPRQVARLGKAAEYLERAAAHKRTPAELAALIRAKIPKLGNVAPSHLK